MKTQAIERQSMELKKIKLGRRLKGYMLLLFIVILLSIFAQLSWVYSYKILVIAFSMLVFLSMILLFASIVEKVDILKQLES